MARKKIAKSVSFSTENQYIEQETEDQDTKNENPQTIVKKEDITNILLPDDADEDANFGRTHVVIQLPISTDHIKKILSQDDMCNPLEYNPKIPEPTAYTPVNFFSSKNDEINNGLEDVPNENENENENTIKENSVTDTLHHQNNDSNKPLCFWCCHPIEHNQFGMPIRYDRARNNFTLFGTFCSLECASAHNFNIHMGSDRAWDVQGWIQIMARNYGIMDPIRPAPSRYSLDIFDGSLSINEFRNIHKTFAKSILVNIPPLVSTKPQIETLNTSFFSLDASKDATDGTKKTLKRKAPANEVKKTLESKMNLSYTSLTNLTNIIETS